MKTFLAILMKKGFEGPGCVSYINKTKSTNKKIERKSYEIMDEMDNVISAATVYLIPSRI